MPTLDAISIASIKSWAVLHPPVFPEGNWDLQSKLGAQDVWLRSDGVRIHSWWIPKEGARFATLFLHGNAVNVSQRDEHIRTIRKAGSALLILDYHGFGKSGGRRSVDHLYSDGQAGYNYLLRGYARNRIIVHGESLGTTVAVDLAARKSCAGLILEAPFTSGGDLVVEKLLRGIGRLFPICFNSKRQILRVRCPLLIIHGNKDEVIPISLGRALFAAANKPKSFWTVPGAGHNDLVEVAGVRYGKRLRSFYKSL